MYSILYNKKKLSVGLRLLPSLPDVTGLLEKKSGKYQKKNQRSGHKILKIFSQI